MNHTADFFKSTFKNRLSQVKTFVSEPFFSKSCVVGYFSPST